MSDDTQGGPRLYTLMDVAREHFVNLGPFFGSELRWTEEATARTPAESRDFAEELSEFLRERDIHTAVVPFAYADAVAASAVQVDPWW